jgi:hypothetical protein
VSESTNGADLKKITLNNVMFSFNLNETTPSLSKDEYHSVTVKIQNSGIMIGSIKHNLPSSEGQRIRCVDITNNLAQSWVLFNINKFLGYYLRERWIYGER